MHAIDMFQNASSPAVPPMLVCWRLPGMGGRGAFLKTANDPEPVFGPLLLHVSLFGNGLLKVPGGDTRRDTHDFRDAVIGSDLFPGRLLPVHP
jgi:hypothetical protein